MGLAPYRWSAQCIVNFTGTPTHASTALPPACAGLNVHCRTHAIAASSSPGTETVTFTSPTEPSVFTNACSWTVPWVPAARAESGYLGGTRVSATGSSSTCAFVVDLGQRCAVSAAALDGFAAALAAAAAAAAAGAAAPADAPAAAPAAADGVAAPVAAAAGAAAAPAAAAAPGSAC